MDFSVFGRVLEDDHDHDGHGHSEEDEKLLIARIIMIVLVIFAGSFVFVPYSKFVRGQEEKDAAETKDT